jgi:hypothetical protein
MIRRARGSAISAAQARASAASVRQLACPPSSCVGVSVGMPAVPSPTRFPSTPPTTNGFLLQPVRTRRDRAWPYGTPLRLRAGKRAELPQLSAALVAAAQAAKRPSAMALRMAAIKS